MTEDYLKLFVTSLPDDWDHEKIEEYFSTQAIVLEVEVFKDQDRSKCKQIWAVLM
jgi:RNA recognition motif. (a.k.a. RRM, RBD, or RNP domain)